ncbi:NfeD family protein [Kingella negevensis]|uniref:NfeD-like C-terminal domain-containing protein n=1 Tax=Kingella negevensis TaxID=1522312 RepID=A0A238HIA7_9NEIS|nr:NfeD family protein [Kingella negevensis]MDK4684647.1 NfeD family protein [Kingella negevensis]MDK4708158.1 NfeD family protein [Kingella negevensis]MDK4709723.1 NfeD family protein [Kingella negevensis]SNB78217.1 Uncharacterised protein [Kingella negevensis]
MALWTIWLIAAALIFTAEMFTGTVYLLVLAGALACSGALIWLLDLGISTALLCTGVLSLIGICLVQFGRSSRLSKHSDDFDVGELVQIEQPLGNGRWRVFYRGTTWEARPIRGEEFQMGDSAQICGKDGIVLLIKAV